MIAIPRKSAQFGAIRRNSGAIRRNSADVSDAPRASAQALEARVEAGNQTLAARSELAVVQQQRNEARAAAEAAEGREGAMLERVAALEAMLAQQRDHIGRTVAEAALRIERSDAAAAGLRRERDALITGRRDGSLADGPAAEVERLRSQLNKQAVVIAGYRSSKYRRPPSGRHGFRT